MASMKRRRVLISRCTRVARNGRVVVSNNLKAVNCNLPNNVKTGVKGPSEPIVIVSNSNNIRVGVRRLTATILRRLPIVLYVFGGRCLKVMHR